MEKNFEVGGFKQGWSDDETWIFKSSLRTRSQYLKLLENALTTTESALSCSRRFSVLIMNFEQTCHINLVFSLLTLNK